MKKTAFILGGIMLLGGAAYGASKIIKPNDDKNEIIIKKDAEIEDLQNKLANANAKIIALENALQTLQQKYDNLESSSALEKTELLAQINALKNELLEEQEAKALLETQLQDALAQIASGQKVFEFYEDLSSDLQLFEKIEDDVDNAIDISGVRHASYNFYISRYRPELGTYSTEKINSEFYTVYNGSLIFDNEFVVNEIEENDGRGQVRLYYEPYLKVDDITYKYPISSNYLTLEAKDYILLRKLNTPTPVDIDYLNKEVLFNQVEGAIGYEIMHLESRELMKVSNYDDRFKMDDFKFEYGDDFSIVAKGDNFKNADSKEHVFKINYQKFDAPVLSINDYVLKITVDDRVSARDISLLTFTDINYDYVGSAYINHTDGYLDEDNSLIINLKDLDINIANEGIYQIGLYSRAIGWIDRSDYSNYVEFNYNFAPVKEDLITPIISFNESTYLFNFENNSIEIGDYSKYLVSYHSFDGVNYESFHSGEEIDNQKNFFPSFEKEIDGKIYLKFKVHSNSGKYNDSEFSEVLIIDSFIVKEYPKADISILENNILSFSYDEAAPFDLKLTIAISNDYGSNMGRYSINLKPGEYKDFDLSFLESGNYVISFFIDGANRPGYTNTSVSQYEGFKVFI